MRLSGLKRSRVIHILTVLTVLMPGAALAMPWSWDMFNQQSHKAQEERALAVPEGTVSTRGRLPLKDREAAANLKNPVATTPENIEKGKVKFQRYCVPCHGESGKGDGPVGQKFGSQDLTSEYVQTKPDGDIYYTITNGGIAIMPSYGDSVVAEDRWFIVTYIKQVLSGKK